MGNKLPFYLYSFSFWAELPFLLAELSFIFVLNHTYGEYHDALLCSICTLKSAKQVSETLEMSADFI